MKYPTKREYSEPYEMHQSKKLKQDPQTEPMKITDLNVDCLEHIFQYLNSVDLNNTAESHGQFVSVCRLIYKRDHRHKMVIISDVGHKLTLTNGSDKEIVNVAAITFLQHFGHLIGELMLDYICADEDDNGYEWREIEKHVFTYCSKTLLKLILRNCHGNVMEEIEEPFDNVKKLRLYGGDTKMIDISKWFPNISSMKLDHHALCTMVQYDQLNLLKKLKILISETGRPWNIERKLRQLLRLNRRIKNLFIESTRNDWLSDPTDFMLFLSQTSTHLKVLRLKMYFSKTADSAVNIHFKNVKHFELLTEPSGGFPDNVSITFGCLNILKLYNFDGNDINWNQFISQNQNLVELGYFPYHSLVAGNLHQIMQKLPTLTTVAIQARAISPNDLNQLLIECMQSKLTTFDLRSFSCSVDFNEYIVEIESSIRNFYEYKRNDITGHCTFKIHCRTLK